MNSGGRSSNWAARLLHTGTERSGAIIIKPWSICSRVACKRRDCSASSFLRALSSASLACKRSAVSISAAACCSSRSRIDLEFRVVRGKRGLRRRNWPKRSLRIEAKQRTAIAPGATQLLARIDPPCQPPPASGDGAAISEPSNRAAGAAMAPSEASSVSTAARTSASPRRNTDARLRRNTDARRRRNTDARRRRDAKPARAREITLTPHGSPQRR